MTIFTLMLYKKLFTLSMAIAVVGASLFTTSCSTEVGNGPSGSTNTPKQRLVSEIEILEDDDKIIFCLSYDEQNRINSVTHVWSADDIDPYDITYFDNSIAMESVDGYVLFLELNDKGYVKRYEEDWAQAEYTYDGSGYLRYEQTFYPDEPFDTNGSSHMFDYEWKNGNYSTITEIGGYNGAYDSDKTISKMECNTEKHNLINVDLNRFVLAWCCNEAGHLDWLYFWFLDLFGKKSANYVTSHTMEGSDGDKRFKAVSTLKWSYDNGYPVMCRINCLEQYVDSGENYSSSYIVKIKYLD